MSTSEFRDVPAFLITIVTRPSLDRLKSAKRERDLCGDRQRNRVIAIYFVRNPTQARTSPGGPETLSLRGQSENTRSRRDRRGRR